MSRGDVAQPKGALISTFTQDLQAIPPFFGRSGVRNTQTSLPIALGCCCLDYLCGSALKWVSELIGVKNQNTFRGVFYRSFHIACSSAATYSWIGAMEWRSSFERAASASLVDKEIVTEKKCICSLTLFWLCFSAVSGLLRRSILSFRFHNWIPTRTQ